MKTSDCNIVKTSSLSNLTVKVEVTDDISFNTLALKTIAKLAVETFPDAEILKVFFQDYLIAIVDLADTSKVAEEDDGV